jgi:anti-sigma factor RsiW
MSCNTIQTKLSAYIDGEMSGSEMLLTRSHVNHCPRCQSELESLKSIQMVLRGLPVGPEPSPFLPSLMKQRVVARKRNRLRLGFMVAVPVAALAAFAFIRPKAATNHVQDRDLVINRQLAKDQIYDAGNDSTSGASLVHYTNYEGH